MEDYTQDISGRILSSASGLLRDSLSPRNTQQARTLAHVLASEGKAGPSTASANTHPIIYGELREGPNTCQAPISLAGINDREAASAKGSVDPGLTDTAQAMSLDQFIHNEHHLTEPPVLRHCVDKQHAGSEIPNGKMSAIWDSIVYCEPPHAFLATEHGGANITNEVYRAHMFTKGDGADVVKLLKGRNSSLWMDMHEEQESPDMISEADKKFAEKLVCHINKAMSSKPSYKSAVAAANRGDPFPKFSSFFDNITHYQEEVWGYLQPLVEKARAEYAVSSSPDEAEGPASRRLRMILAHVDTSP